MPGTNEELSEPGATLLESLPAPPDDGFNPFDPAFLADPYPEYARLRDTYPVYTTPLGFTVLFRHDDVVDFLRDPALSVEERHQRPTPVTQMIEALVGERAEIGNKSMLNRDAPDHTRLRRLVSQAFTPKTIESLTPRIRSFVDRALEPLSSGDEIDLISTLAFPVPFEVICEMLGMPPTDRDDVRAWSHLMVRSLEPLVDPELIVAIADAGDQMRALLADVIAWKRQYPAPDMLSAMIAAEEQGDVLTDEELLEQLMLLFIAGHETTVNLIGNGVRALLRNPESIPRFANDPVNAVEELLRFDSPVQMSRRITLREVEVRGQTIEQGQFVVLVLASANRDAAFWGGDAERLDLARAMAPQNLSFGGGHHYCLGAALARLEGRIAIGSLLERFPNTELAGEPQVNGRINLRGYERLPVRLS
ncbi:MAG TPA: cytochrome P450 [Actinomycetota bacterium]|nr:cytochrome P450 [Actinomycetota bacterium]